MLGWVVVDRPGVPSPLVCAMHRLRRSLLLLMRVAVVCVLFGAVVRATVFTVYRVAGTSMLETLFDGDRILVCDTPWVVQPVEAGDTVVFEVEGEILVKRVAGKPGDRVSMRRGVLMRNGKVVDEEIPRHYDAPVSMRELKLGADEYFMLGDHRAVSVDSRDFGPIDLSQIIGTVMLRMSGSGFSPVAALDHSE